MARVRCPYCGGEFDAGNAKTWVTCPHCEEAFHVLREGATVLGGSPRCDDPTRADASDAATEARESPFHGPEDPGRGLEWLRNRFRDKYEIEEFVSRGGMGAVYRARQRKPSREVALKVMLSADLDSENMRRRFEREAQAAALLNHPAIVPLYEYGEVDGQPYFTMEYVRGSDLKSYVRENKVDRSEICRLMVEICRAVSYAHGRGVIHRDLKPSNIIIDEEGRPRVLDFGLSRITHGIGSLGQTLTMSGDVVGTPLYMSPEQARGRPDMVDQRSDVYSLGVIFYELVVGVLPYHMAQAQGLGALEILKQAQPVRPTLLHGWMPEELEAILMKALEKEQDGRYQTALALAKDIENFLADRPVSARPHNLLYRVRKFVWRNRRVLVPAALGVGATLVVGGILAHELLSTSAQVERQEKMLARMKDAPSELLEMARQGKWQEAYAAARYAEQNMGDLPGVTGITARMENMARRKFREKLDEVKTLVARQEYEKASTALAELTTRAEDLPFEDIKSRVSSFEDGFADYCREQLRESVDRAYTRQRTMQLMQDYLAWVDDDSQEEEIRSLLAERRDAPPEHYLEQHAKAARRRLRASEWSGVEAVLESAQGLMQDSSISNSKGWAERFEAIRADFNTVIRPETAGKVQQVEVLDGHSGMVKDLSFGPRDEELASIGLDGKMRTWAVPDWSRNGLLPHEGHLWSVAWSPDAGMLAAGDDEGNVHMWLLGKGGGRRVVQCHETRVKSLGISQDGEMMVTASASEVKLWEVSSGRALALPAEADLKMMAIFSPTEPLLAARNSRGDVELWDMKTRRKVDELILTSRAEKMAFSPDGRRLACSDSRNTIFLWDVDSRETLRTFKGGGKLWALALSPAGDLLACGGVGNEITLWDTATGEPLAVLEGHEHWVMSLDFSGDSRWLASCSNDQTVRIWGIPQKGGAENDSQ